MTVWRSPPLERPIKLTISYTHSCNLDCQTCYADCTRTPDAAEVTGPEWRRIIDDAIAAGVISLMFEGGEPLLRADLPAVLRHCSDRAMTRLRTNATLIGRDTARALRDANLGDALVDVLGATAATHDALTGTPGSHARLLEGVAHLQDAGIPITLLTIMNRRNVGELQQILELGRRVGAAAVGVLRPYPLGRMRRNWDRLSLSLPEMMAAIAALRVPDGIRLMQSWHPNDANCCWQMAAADAHGRSIGCTYLREYVDYGSLRAQTLLDTWSHPLYRRLRAGRVSRACGACAKTQASHGGCRSTAYAFHGDWDAPDPFDAPLNDGLDLRTLPPRPPPPPDPSRISSGSAPEPHAPEPAPEPPGTPRLRPAPELELCLAYTSSPPRLHTLNPTAWLLLELARRFAIGDLRDQFLSRNVPPMTRDDAERHFADGMAQLRAAGLIAATEPAP